jgi:hypothetical protein
MVADNDRGRLICVVEDHRALAAGAPLGPTGGRIPEPANSLASVDIETGALSTLAQGYDFYSTPRLSPDGSRLACRGATRTCRGTVVSCNGRHRRGMASSPTRAWSLQSDESNVQPE